jgi:ADP-heptose:LPS heptosyltransferase
LKPLLENKEFNNHGVAFYSFQIDERRADLNFLEFNTNVMDLSSQIKNFADTALLMKQMDLMITIDSAPAHLAGSLGIPTWVLLLYYSDWRWQEQNEKSMFYPNMRLFRQPHPHGWQAVIENLQHALDEFVAQSCTLS